MTNKNIQMKKKQGDTWDNLFPITLQENVFNNKGIDLDSHLDNLEEEIDNTLSQANEYTDEKLSNIRMIAEYDVDPTGETDSLSGFEQALNDLGDSETLLLQADATYYLSEPLVHKRGGGVSIDGNGATFRTNVNTKHGKGIEFKGIEKTETLLNNIDTNVVSVSSTENIEVGDLLYFQSDEQFNNQRLYYKKGGVKVVNNILDNTTLVMSSGFPYDISQAIITVYKPITAKLENFNVINNYDPINYTNGLSIMHSVDTRLDNIYSSHFDICIHLREHYQTSIEQVSTGKAHFEGTTQSYGLASYISNNLLINNSRFISGRNGLEITGFESSFNTLILNTDAGNEGGTDLNTAGFNQHQSSYGLLAMNSQFEGVGLSGHSILYNCEIYGNVRTRIYVSNNFEDSSFVFENCKFPYNHQLNIAQGGTGSSSSGQPVEPLPKKIGGLTIRDCKTINQFRITMSTIEDSIIDNIKIENTDMVLISDIYNNPTINRITYVDSNLTKPYVLFSQQLNAQSYFKEIYFVRCKIMAGYNAFNLHTFDKLIFDSCIIINDNDSPTRWSFESSTGGEIRILNTDFSNVLINTPGESLDRILLIGSEANFRSTASSVGTIQETTLQEITV